MALVVEDGTGVTGANTYISETEYTTWANDRFGSARSTLPADTAAYEAIIKRAMDYLETLEFKGIKKERDQALQWPRYDVYIDGYYVDSDSIPQELKNAVFELTYAEETNVGEFAQVSRETKREKVGPVEVEYSDSAASRTISPSISATLRKLVAGGSGSSFSVSRA